MMGRVISAPGERDLRRIAKRKFLSIIARAMMMGLAWAAAWVPVGVVAGRLIVGELEPEHIGGSLYAGFVCGTIFSAVTGIAAGRRRLAELPLGRTGAWGAASALLAGVLPFVLGDTSGEAFPWLQVIAVIGGLALLSAGSAVVSILVARSAKKGTRAVI
jgi:hypothetical protein